MQTIGMKKTTSTTTTTRVGVTVLRETLPALYIMENAFPVCQTHMPHHLRYGVRFGLRIRMEHIDMHRLDQIQQHNTIFNVMVRLLVFFFMYNNFNGQRHVTN